MLATNTLGTGGPAVGAIGLGCMGMSHGYDPHGRDDAASAAVIGQALDAGVNLLDTADVYGPCTNEELVGAALAGRRDEAVLATKVGLVADGRHPLGRRNDGRPEHVRASIDASLRRLGTDRVDLYQLHRVDPEVPIEESWAAMAEAVAAGKAGRIGLSEVSVAEIERASAVHPVASVQSELSVWTPEALADVVPYCQANGIAFLAYAPLGRGFLTGRFRSADDIADGDWRRTNPRFQPDALDANRAITDAIRRIAERRGAGPGQVALAWTRAQAGCVVPIPGTKTPRYLAENAAAAGVELTSEDLAELDAAPPAVGTRYRFVGSARP
ncbi:aldo/keto reductase [Streptomonospora salina]|uniref:Aryl-alcohol dehydrogenase-like predicted oxidoreductase n=1 Tax=Streptomonospora salina TaxID=104205 RepID=A0A841EK07_9ACTN|nr:aldo/keto reductase [Streptomonospora salina]MBB6001108.1 aryl-alcohol dehydrogenase-like predicted oxidoreductase [Streptomonospora salina]